MSSSRNSRIQERRARQQRRRFVRYALVALGAVGVFGALVWLNRPTPPGDVTLPDSLEPPPGAEAKAWGPEAAPVLIEEFSDFQ